MEIPNYGEISQLELDAKDYLRRTTVLYGVSSTGKSVIIKKLLDVLKPFVPVVLCVCPTNAGNGDYDGRIDPQCIKTRVDVNDLVKILNRQKAVVDMYKRVNDFANIEPIYKRCKTSKTEDALRNLNNILANGQNSIERNTKLNPIQKREELKKIGDKIENSKRYIMKKCITDNKRHLRLDETEKKIVKFLWLDPNFLLIMDDCAAFIKKWGDSESVSEIFYQGRHWYITSVYTMQDDKSFPTEIRRNTFMNFFTDPTSAIGFFSNTSNNFPKQIKTMANSIANQIFKNPEAHCKMVYNRLSNQFNYVLVDDYSNEMFGCKFLSELCDDKKKEENPFDKLI